MRFLVTGCAGFIGFHLSKKLLADGHQVVGYDGFTQYYDVRLKHARIEQLKPYNDFTVIEGMLEDVDRLRQAFELSQPDVVVHLAAQAGVRYSLENPRAYANANLIGSFNLLDLAREFRPKHLMLASTSSVYGANVKMPFTENDTVSHPLTLYAATKVAMESMAHSYAQLWKLPTTCFRFFTVYGPWGRPDMALFNFVDAIINDRPIEIYGEGKMKRDFTYIDDLVEAIDRLVDCAPVTGEPVSDRDSLSPVGPFRIVNIAGGEPRGLLDFVETIETSLDQRAQRKLLPMQMGDVTETFADHRLLEQLTGFRPATPLSEGVDAFVHWYRSYYNA